MKILISPGFGAGWSTWAGDEVANYVLTYRPIIEAIERGEKIDEDGPYIKQLQKDLDRDLAHLIDPNEKNEEDRHVYFYPGGARDLTVREVQGAFKINEYDGSESIQYRDDTDWCYGE